VSARWCLRNDCGTADLDWRAVGVLQWATLTPPITACDWPGYTAINLGSESATCASVAFARVAAGAPRPCSPSITRHAPARASARPAPRPRSGTAIPLLLAAAARAAASRAARSAAASAALGPPTPPPCHASGEAAGFVPASKSAAVAPLSETPTPCRAACGSKGQVCNDVSGSGGPINWATSAWRCRHQCVKTHPRRSLARLRARMPPHIPPPTSAPAHRQPRPPLRSPHPSVAQ
jgi:hypothetical protein